MRKESVPKCGVQLANGARGRTRKGFHNGSSSKGIVVAVVPEASAPWTGQASVSSVVTQGMCEPGEDLPPSLHHGRREP